VAGLITKCGSYYKVWQLLQSAAQQDSDHDIPGGPKKHTTNHKHKL